MGSISAKPSSDGFFVSISDISTGKVETIVTLSISLRFVNSVLVDKGLDSMSSKYGGDPYVSITGKTIEGYLSIFVGTVLESSLITVVVKAISVVFIAAVGVVVSVGLDPSFGMIWSRTSICVVCFFCF